jgi:hypothetical protein
MAGLAGIDEQRTPGTGNVLGDIEGAERIVAAGNQDRRERQRLARSSGASA